MCEFKLTKACAMCPFKKDTFEGWLGEERAQEIADSLLYEGKTFPCHKTTVHDENGDVDYGNQTQHCAGALNMLETMNKPNQMMRIAERLGLYNHTKLQDAEECFEHADDFVERHT